MGALQAYSLMYFEVKGGLQLNQDKLLLKLPSLLIELGTSLGRRFSFRNTIWMT